MGIDGDRRHSTIALKDSLGCAGSMGLTEAFECSETVTRGTKRMSEYWWERVLLKLRLLCLSR